MLKFTRLLFFNLLFFFVLLLLIDNIIFYTSHLFPKKFWKYLSYKSQVEYILKNEKDSHYIFDDYIYYHKPNAHGQLVSDGKKIQVYYDQFGYANPVNYLDSGKIEVLLIGDSYTEHPDLSDSFRSFFNGKVYSIGVGGQGIFHWNHQYRRFKKIYHGFTEPKIIILNYYENDISDTLRAIKYERAGYINSAYYPQNEFGHFFKKIDRKYSFYHEIYSIFRYFINLYRVRDRLSEILLDYKFFDENFKTNLEKLKILPKKNKNLIELLNYNQECQIKIERNDPKKKLFSENLSTEIIQEILKMIKLIDFDKTKVFFSYIPTAQTIYYDKFRDDKLMKDTFEVQKMSSKNFKNFFNNSKFPVKYIDVTPKLISLAKNFPLHPCNGTDSHFNKFGFKEYSRLLSSEIKKHINKN